ncbi:MAG TPA: DAK2 domain-containing protein [Dehalococcoidia bacterium]|nr:DAK2 domain-containing protein [Dehalococcoidia bacterium]
MNDTREIDGKNFIQMFSAATNWLEKSASDIDALNVFPVPDGDCGTNMLLTMRSCIEEAYRSADHNVSSVVQAMYRGALMGARGNSGVILSQIWRGIANSLDKKKLIDGNDLAEALLQAAETAYKGLSNPVEGTMLTVIREVAMIAKERSPVVKGDLVSVLDAAVAAAREAVARTPELLPVLREAGVVDAGGQGLYTLLEGALLFLKGEENLMKSGKSKVVASSAPVSVTSFTATDEEEVPYGYCTEFLLKGKNLNPDKIRDELSTKGQSLIVVGDESTVRVHIHVPDPGEVIHYAASLGTMHGISIRNMDEQHEEFLARQKQKKMPSGKIGVIAVASGDGLTKVFESLGASAIVYGGQTMNPSTRDMLRAVDTVPANKVLILPNNENIILTARQAASLTNKEVEVIPTESIPQGVAALMAFDPDADLQLNINLMQREIEAVKTIEVTHASRSTKLNGLNIKKGQVIGLLDGKLVAAGDSLSSVVDEVLSSLSFDEAQLLTIYSGRDVPEAESKKLSNAIQRQHPSLEIEVVNGGQPHYDYIISLE